MAALLKNSLCGLDCESGLWRLFRLPEERAMALVKFYKVLEVCNNEKYYGIICIK